MNILYIAHRIPYPPNKGDKIRAYHELKALAEIGKVFLCALVDDPEDWQYKKDLESFCKEVALVGINPKWKKIVALSGILRRKPMSVLYFYERCLQEQIDIILEKNEIDAICCFSGTSAEYLDNSSHAERLFNIEGKKPVLIMDFCDVDSLKWQEYAQRSSFPLSILYKQEGQLLKAYERKIVRKFDTSIIITENEKVLFLEKVDNNADLLVIGNGVDLEFFDPEEGTKTTPRHDVNEAELLFVGAMDYQANVDGVCWFAEEVWPKILKCRPDTTFTIVGRNPSRGVQALHGKHNITVTGGVDDIRPYYQRATIVVVPLIIARGIQNKILEAMAMSKAIVSTEAAYEGIDAKPGRDLFVAENGKKFAEHIYSLLENVDLQKQVGENARKAVVEKYQWSVKMARLIDVLPEPCKKRDDIALN